MHRLFLVVILTALVIAPAAEARHLLAETWVASITQHRLNEEVVGNLGLPAVLAVQERDALLLWIEQEERPDALGTLGITRFVGSVSEEEVSNECRDFIRHNPHPDDGFVAQLCINEIVVRSDALILRGYIAVYDGSGYYRVEREVVPSSSSPPE